VLSDFRLRGSDSGIATVKAIRGLVPNTPALLISGDTAPERLIEAQAAGLTIIHKPVTAEVLRRAVLNALEASTSAMERRTAAG
jgi:DNA-binding NtrC family response regulator